MPVGTVFNVEQTKRMPVKDVMRIAGISNKCCKRITWRTTQITVKPMLTLHEYLETVHDILCDCQAPDGGVAIPLIDFAFRANIISAFACVELPKDADDLCYVVYGSDLFETVYRACSKSQIDAIKEAVLRCAGAGDDYDG